MNRVRTLPAQVRPPLSPGQWLCAWLTAWMLGTVAAPAADEATLVPGPPRLSPDYAGITIPPNVAPLNFVVDEPDVRRHRVRFVPTVGEAFEVAGDSASVTVPPRSWKTLLEANRGRSIQLEIQTAGADGRWRSFEPVTNQVSGDPMDGHLVYRMLRPVYNVYGPIGIYQRDLGSFEQRPILENRQLDEGCLNCHTFLNHRPEQMALHIRNKEAGNPLLLVTSNQVTKVAKTAGYLSWHPSGRLLAFSVNKFALLFHTTGETRDLWDAASDLGIYRVDSNLVVTPSVIAQPEYAETWPSWAPDGRHLYYCRAPKLKIERLKQVRYDLVRVLYDLEKNRWGEPEVMVSARDTRLSAAQPRVSPDGRWLLYCLSPYGNFPAYSAGSDLHLMDLNTRASRRLDINSDLSDSWHCWSSNGRWVVFSSKRRDGLFTRPYFTHMDEAGNFTKPFILPQEDPTFYDWFDRTYNLPEFIQGPVTVSSRDLREGAFHPRRELKPGSEVQSAPVEEHEADEGRTVETKKP